MPIREPVFTSNMAHCGNFTDGSGDCRGVVHVIPEHGERVKCDACGAEGRVEVGPGDTDIVGNYGVVWTAL